MKSINKAFTLIEVMIVVGIIALLAVIAIVSLRGELFKGNDARRKADLNRISEATEEYEKDHNCYPKIEDMQSCGSDPSIAIHPYLSNVPCDPITHAYYYYEPQSGATCPTWYRLYAAFQNTADSSTIPNIGLGSAYNYYVRSPNAPVIVGGQSSPIPSGGGGGTVLYACKHGACVQITTNWDGSATCQTAYGDSSCPNSNNCAVDCTPHIVPPP